MELLYKEITPDGKIYKTRIDCKDAEAYKKLMDYLQDDPATIGLAFLLRNAQEFIKDCETFETIELCDVYSEKTKGEK